MAASSRAIPLRAPLGVTHFGEYVGAQKMTREGFGLPRRAPKQRIKRERLSDVDWERRAWMFRDEDQRELSDLFLLMNRDDALRNYDLSMEYFASLDPTDFEVALEYVLKKARYLKPVQDLADWNHAAGVYLMVFDEYKQFYVGKANDIRDRIRTHWGTHKPFDRLVFGSLYTSIFPVDELKAMDNTRIFASRSRNPYSLEERAEDASDPRFSLNRMVGGEATPLLLAMTLASPRERILGHPVTLDTWDLLDRAEEELRDAIDSARAGDEAVLPEVLAAMDMSIYANTRDDGSTYTWSRRDLVNIALVRGDLRPSEFEAFLSLMGETVVWPAEKAARRR